MTNANKTTVNADSYQSTGSYLLASQARELVPPLFNDYDAQRIYFPTPIEHSEGLGLAAPANYDGTTEIGAFDPCLHMKEAINCLHQDDELMQLVAIDSKTGDKLVAPMVEAGDELVYTSLINGRGYDVYFNLNPLKSSKGLEIADEPYKFDEVSDDYREATGDDVEYIKYFLVEVEPIEVAGDDTNCLVDANFERVEAEAVAWYIVRALKELAGFKTCFMAYDGKSYNLIWRVNLPANKDSERLLGKCLEALDSQFATDCARINTNRNHALEWIRLYGTENFQTKQTEKHPVTCSHIVHAPVTMEVVGTKKLKKLAAMAPKNKNSGWAKAAGLRNRLYTSADYKNEKAEVVKVFSELFSASMCAWSTEVDGYIVQLPSDFGTDKYYELLADNFVKRLKAEIERRLGKTVFEKHIVTAVVTTDSLYRVRDDMAGIRRYIAGKEKITRK